MGTQIRKPPVGRGLCGLAAMDCLSVVDKSALVASFHVGNFFKKFYKKRLQNSVCWRIIIVWYGIGAYALKFLAVTLRKFKGAIMDPVPNRSTKTTKEIPLC